MEFKLNKTNDYILKLDPVTKIIILAILSFIVFANAPLSVTIILVLIPFICLLLSKHEKMAITYIILYIIAKYSMIYLIPDTHGALNTLIIIFSNITCRILPGAIMAYYVITTTKVSEFIASMERINIPDTIIIPFSVIFRYFPTLFDEIKAIRDAMKMRGIGINLNSVKSPLTLLEYLFVPILINAVKTSDELSAASLTRGLSNPKKRTNICETGIRFIDIILIIISLLGLAIYLLYEFGGLKIA